MDIFLPLLEILIIQVPWKGPIIILFSPCKKFVLTSRSIPTQGAIDPLSYLQILQHRRAAILLPKTSTFSDHIPNIMVSVDIAPSGTCFLIVSPYGSRFSIYIGSCVSSSEQRLQFSLLPLGDNKYYKSRSIFLWTWNSVFIRIIRLYYLLSDSHQ